MSTVDASDWFRQSSSPIIDGNYPKSARPSGAGNYFGYVPISVTSINTPAITLIQTSDEAPKAVMASADQTTAVGTRDLTTRPLNPYQDLHHHWELTFQNGDPVEDLEGWTDPRNGNAANPYTDQISGEFTCVARQPGDYRLTKTTWGMTATKGFVIQDIQTIDFTVLPSTKSRQYFDNTGNDANDGFDPHGFGLSGATFDSGTRILTGATNDFLSYDHAAATTGVYTYRTNWIYLIGIGWKEIEEKIDNENIRLVDGTGVPATGISSSDGPKQTFSGSLANDTEHYLKGGQTFTTSQQMRWNLISGATAVYGTNSQATINGVTQLVNGGLSGNNTPGDFFGFGNVILDGTDTQICYGAIITAPNNPLQGTYFLDNVDVVNTNAAIGINCNFTGANTTYAIFIHRGNIDNGTVGAGKQHSIFTRNDQAPTRIVAVTLDVRSNNLVLDHFIYPNGLLNYAHFAYINFRNAPIGTNYCINTNSITGIGVAEYISINNNFFSADAFFGMDLSNASNNSGDGQFQNVVVMNNKCNVIRGLAFYYSGIDTAFRYNQDYGTFNSQNSYAENAGTGYDNTVFQGTVFRNQTYGRPVTFFVSGQDREIVENECHIPTDVDCFRYDSALLDARVSPQFIGKDNNLYAPNKVDGNVIQDGGVDVSLASFNAGTYGDGNTSTDPGWPDPANGNFGGDPTGEPIQIV